MERQGEKNPDFLYIPNGAENLKKFKSSIPAWLQSQAVAVTSCKRWFFTSGDNG
jgi:hypothetical protein